MAQVWQAINSNSLLLQGKEARLQLSLTMIIGPMFAYKSTRLREYVVRHELAGQQAVIFKPGIDTRYSAQELVTHDLLRHPAVVVSADTDGFIHIAEYVEEKDPSVIGVDEAQFFPTGLVETMRYYSELGKTVYVSGLNLDFRGEPFPTVKELLPYADRITYLTAVCRYPGCGREATRTQRIVNGRPANYNDPLVVIGGADKYEARCVTHHFVEGSPRPRLPSK